MKIFQAAAAVSLAAALFVADRLLKILFYQYFPPKPLFSVGNLFSLEFFSNRGIAFSLPLPLPLTITLSVIIILILILSAIVVWQKKKTYLLWPIILLLFGAVSNCWDRIRWGMVVDYFNLRYFTAFNLADLMITAGLLWLLAIMIRREQKQ